MLEIDVLSLMGLGGLRWIYTKQMYRSGLHSRLYQMIRGNIEPFWILWYVAWQQLNGEGGVFRFYFSPEALEELEAEECLHLLVGDIAPGQKQQQLRGRRPGKAFPASSQIDGFDGTNTATAFCGLENCRCHSTWMLFLTTKLRSTTATHPLQLRKVTHNSMHIIFLDTAVIQS